VANKFSLILPIAGKGTRFLNQGITAPKPLVTLRGRPMWEWALGSLPMEVVDEVVIVQHMDYPIFKPEDAKRIEFGFNAAGIKFQLVVEATPRAGAAKSVWNGLATISSADKPVIVANCDQVYQAAPKSTSTLGYNPFSPEDVLDGRLDGLIPCFEAAESKWSYAEAGRDMMVTNVVEKPGTPPSRFATVGVYYFSTAKLLSDAIDAMVTANATVNGEFYLAPCYNFLSRKAVGIQYVSKMWGLGTPEDLDIFVRDHRYLGFEIDWRQRNTFGTVAGG
jgi:dTDP-glucose pyrophosphorylase